jgi:serine/threonine-protein kinase
MAVITVIGKTVSHYKILEKLGSGGMGVVYKAEDTRLKRTVALKFLPSDLTRDQEAKQRFLHEAQAASAIDHPNICSIYHIDELEDGQIYIVMACYEGNTLEEKMKDGPLNLQETIEVAIQITQGLENAHKSGIIHRDIKPANIFITEDKIVKIVDFGLAKLSTHSKLTRLGSTVGTIAYMSPEQTRGTAVDHRTDIWSLGVVLYQMITGQLPFKGDYEQAIIYSILNEEPEKLTSLRSDVPVKLERIVNKALVKDPAGRYQAAEELLAALRFSGRETADKVSMEFTTQPELPSSQDPIQSLVVLPLANLSNDPEQEYFADGMTEALITDLAKLQVLKVISRTSAMRYKASEKSLPEIARELQVDAVVEGSVLRVGQQVRITAQLIHAPSDTHLWAESYDRNWQDVLYLQSEVAQAIAQEIKLNVTIQDKSRFAAIRPENQEAYDAYLKGRFHFYKLSPENFDKALEYYHLALQKDPDYALAYVGIANNWFARAYWGLDPPREYMPKSKEAVLKAIELDNQLEEAHDTLGRIKYFYEWDWSAADKAFQKAIQINPNYVDVRLFYSSYLRSVKRPDEALTQIERGLELDPLNYFTQGFYVAHLLFLKRHDDAISQLDKILKVEPNFPMAHRYLWIAFHQEKQYERAYDEARKYFASLGKHDFTKALACGFKENGYPGAMFKAAEKMVERSRETHVQPSWIARLFAHAGEIDQALNWLEKAYQERDLLLVNLNVSSDWDNLHAHPRFQRLLQCMNFSN